VPEGQNPVTASSEGARGGGFRGSIAAWATFAVTFLGALVAWMEFQAAAHRDAIEHSLSFEAYYKGVDASKIYFDLVRLWSDKQPALDAAMAKAATTGEDQNCAYRRFVRQMVADAKLDFQVIQLVDYYNAFATCVAARICDEETALRFHRKDALNILHNFDAVITNYEQQKHDSDFSEPAWRFFASADVAPPALCRYLPGFASGIAEPLGLDCRAHAAAVARHRTSCPGAAAETRATPAPYTRAR
jgi:hypothetical protein